MSLCVYDLEGEQSLAGSEGDWKLIMVVDKEWKWSGIDCEFDLETIELKVQKLIDILDKR